MKRKGFLYQDICSEKNISKSLLDSAKGKTNEGGYTKWELKE